MLKYWLDLYIMFACTNDYILMFNLTQSIELLETVKHYDDLIKSLKGQSLKWEENWKPSSI